MAIENRRLEQAQLDGLGLIRPLELRLGALKQRIRLGDPVEAHQANGSVVLSIHGPEDVVAFVGELRHLAVQGCGLGIATGLKGDLGNTIGALHALIGGGDLLRRLVRSTANESRNEQREHEPPRRCSPGADHPCTHGVTSSGDMRELRLGGSSTLPPTSQLARS